MADIISGTHPVFNDTLHGFYQEIALRVGVHEEDMPAIFTLSYGPPTKLERQPTSIFFDLQDRYPVSFTCTAGENALLLSAESQRNKTTSLLSIATLLGYQWDNQSNVRFLSDEEFSRKGRQKRDHFTRGQQAHLKITKGHHQLSVEASDREISVVSHAPSFSDTQTFNVQRSWNAFERYMSYLVDVQLVSKGRSFIERVESDVLHDLKEVAQTLMRNADAEGKKLSNKMRRPRLEEEHPVDEGLLKQELEKIRQKLQDNERQRKQHLTRLVSIKDIADRRGQLNDNDLQVIEKLYRLEGELRTAEETKQERIAYQERLQQKEKRIQQLRETCQNLSDQKNAIDESLAILQNAMAVLFDEHRLTESEEVEHLFSCIEVADIQGICASATNGITTESLQLYEALIHDLESVVSPDVVILPLGENIRSSGDLLAQLREDFNRVKSAIEINEIVRMFVRHLEDAGIERTMTPLMYRDLANLLSRYNKELDLLEAEFTADRETEVSTIGEKDVDVVRAQFEEAKRALTLRIQEIKDEIEERLGALEGLSDIPLEKIWSPIAISYLKDMERKAEEVMRKLRVEQHELEREKEQKESSLKKSDQPLIMNQLNKRSISISEFHTAVSYVNEFCEDHEKRSLEYQRSLRSLESLGLAKRLKETIDLLITERCKYYYDNSSGHGKQIPLASILYEQRDRHTTLFQFDHMELERTALSGGTESVMTVRSLASKVSTKPFGTVLLVDEWGDVESIGEPLYREIGQMECILAAVFIKVEDGTELTVRSLN